MGDEIHIGGPVATRELAVMGGIRKDSRVLDICSALGGPARHLAAEFGCRVTGIDATPAMVEKATKRTINSGFDGRVTFRLGNALDLPFRESSFDTVWGQDAWCYVTDKARLIREAARVTKSGGPLHLQTGSRYGRYLTTDSIRSWSSCFFPTWRHPKATYDYWKRTAGM